jgi:hypothetical protein
MRWLRLSTKKSLKKIKEVTSRETGLGWKGNIKMDLEGRA